MVENLYEWSIRTKSPYKLYYLRYKIKLKLIPSEVPSYSGFQAAVDTPRGKFSDLSARLQKFSDNSSFLSKSSHKRYYYSAQPILHDSNFQTVTITWYRLSRSKVYSFHTLSTFLTPLNQELWSIVLWIVNIFDIIKSITMVYRYIVDDIFLFLAREP